MEQTVKRRIEELVQRSNSGLCTFPEVIGTLRDAEVESYFADYRKNETNYYTKLGKAYATMAPELGDKIPLEFDPGALRAAIRAAQCDEIRYPEFKKRSMAAGCVGYFVWIDGKQVSYFGRHGEVHIEKFPGN